MVSYLVIARNSGGKVGGVTKQSPNIISYLIFAKIVLGDCFVAQRTGALPLLAMTGWETCLLLTMRRVTA